jgi:hypothetical protein
MIHVVLPRRAAALMLLGSAALFAACGSNGGSGTTGTTGDTGGAGTAGVTASSSAASGSTGSSSAGVGGSFTTGTGGGSAMTPVRMIPNLMSITFYERTGGTAPNAYEFLVNGPELTVRAPDPLDPASADIVGAGTEYYDVYYSNEDGTFNVDGSYLTISGSFLFTLPAGGGLNLAEIGLNYQGAPTEFGNYVASYVTLGDNKVDASVPNCIDGDLQTHTTMGNTVGSAERLRLTLGFKSSSGVPK